MSVSTARNELPIPRSVGAAVADVSVMSVVALAVSGCAIALSASDGVNPWSVAATAGGVVLNHIGWLFGAYIPVLLGFYVVVIGGQLLGVENVGKTQCALGFGAEVMAASIIPAWRLLWLVSVSPRATRARLPRPPPALPLRTERCPLTQTT